MTAADRTFETSIVPTSASLPTVRHELESWLGEVGVSNAVAGDLVTAASELCTNAIRAARSNVSLGARLEGQTLVMEVRDDGPGFQAELSDEAPDPLADAGRGLFVVRQLVDVLWVESDPDAGGTIARCGRRIT